MSRLLNRQVLRVAKQAALEAGAVLRPSAGRLQTRQIQKKSANNFVTAIDRRSERMIISRIRRHFPTHAILAEESGSTSPGEVTWIIDPIDGTSNFIHGFPMYSISIGIAYGNKMIAGVIYDPSNDELFSAADQEGAFLNGRPIHVSRTKRLANALLVTGVPFRAFKRFKPYMTSLQNLSLGSAGMRRGGSAALDLAYVACGRYDGYWEMSLSPWDIAAGSILVREAGGEVTDLSGGEGFLGSGDILATNHLIHSGMQRFTQVIPCR